MLFRSATHASYAPLVAEGYLHHLVAHYDSLADWTALLPGRMPTCGLALARGGMGNHLMTNVSAADYLTASSRAATNDTFMPVTAAFDVTLSRMALRLAVLQPARAHLLGDLCGRVSRQDHGPGLFFRAQVVPVRDLQLP